MKYKDSGFSRMQDRQRNGCENGKSERQSRRAQVSRISVFYRDHLSNKVEKEWWTSLAIEDMQKIEESYYGQKSMIREDIVAGNMWASFIFFENWEEWFEYIHSEYKPDMAKYRESKLKKLGI
jgi:hypothetical protein